MSLGLVMQMGHSYQKAKKTRVTTDSQVIYKHSNIKPLSKYYKTRSTSELRSDTENGLTLASAEELGGSLLLTDGACLREEGPLSRKVLDCEGFDAPRDAMP